MTMGMPTNQIASIAFCLYALFIETAYSVEMPLDRSRSAKTWVDRRDQGLLKQTFDASCGAASLVNILNNYYGLKLNEFEVLASMRLDRPRVYSLKDLGNAVVAAGFKPIFFSTNYDTLAKLKIPVILHTETLDGGHFSVLRNIDKNYVWLNDPAWGNVRYTKAQFLKVWAIASGTGKGLAVVRKADESKASTNYFGKTPDALVDYYGLNIGEN